MGEGGPGLLSEPGSVLETARKASKGASKSLKASKSASKSLKAAFRSSSWLSVLLTEGSSTWGIFPQAYAGPTGMVLWTQDKCWKSSHLPLTAS